MGWMENKFCYYLSAKPEGSYQEAALPRDASTIPVIIVAEISISKFKVLWFPFHFLLFAVNLGGEHIQGGMLNAVIPNPGHTAGWRTI